MERHLPQVTRALAFLLTVSLLALATVAPAAAVSAPSGTGATGPSLAVPGGPTAGSAKVVIIVGATHSSTSHYRDIADSVYAEAIQYSSNVTKIYSPNATWAVVKPALQGANIVVYLGHGNGWPSPYTYDPAYTTKDGLGLNATANAGDSNTKYYGEPYLANEINLAPNAVVLLNHLCYASGNSEPGYADPTLSVAKQRVDNYGAGFIKAGAGAVIAEGHGSVNGMLRDLFTTNQSVLDLWRNQNDYNGNELSFASSRSSGFSAYMDPESASTGFYRSLVTTPDLRTADVTGVQADGSGTPQPPAVEAPDSIDRLAGADRYATAAAVAQTYAAGVPVVYIATGLNFPDALAGAAAAGQTGGPVLLVKQDSIPASTAAELARLQPARIVILGGTGVVSDAVVAALDAYTYGGVIRLAGENRYATAAAISAATYAPGVPVAYLATGQDFPDALAGAAAAGAQGAPMLLVTKDSLPTATAFELLRLQPGRIVLFGSEAMVSDGVLAALSGYAPGGALRVAGTDRYSTAAAISASTKAPGVSVAYVATGLDFPDALAGAALAGFTQGPLLLVTRDSLPASTLAELDRLGPDRIVILGASGVVSNATATQLSTLTGG
jgi:putative cell wall-binding protein